MMMHGLANVKNIFIISPSLSQAVYTACHNALGYLPKMEDDCECESEK
jgi:hypothetical protein